MTSNTCANGWCHQSFEVTDEDLVFFSKVSPVFGGKKYAVPPPTLCPNCRQQKRLAWRNERSLHKRACDLTGKSIVSLYSTDAAFTVYAQDVWWGDSWDALSFGRDIDLNRPFFEQFAELMKIVPHMGMFISHGENSDYCPYSTDYKDSYMCISGRKGENIYYSFMLNDSRDCMDCYACPQSELCYECVNCVHVYNTIHCIECKNSNDLAFCMNCESCQNCIGCYGLRQQKFHVFNKSVSEEEYHRLNLELRISSSALQEFKKKALAFFLGFPRRNAQMINTEHSSGDYLVNCSNAYCCFLSEDLQDCAYVWNTPHSKDCADINYSSKTQLIYNAMSNVNSYACIGCMGSWDMKNSLYCFQSFYSSDLFGCIGLKHKKYCILNKEYTKEEYETLVPKIIDMMQKNGEWGEFFPLQLSPFAYNESIAHEFFPLSKVQAEELGLSWEEHVESVSGTTKTIPADRLPDSIRDIPDDIVNWGIQCETTGRIFRIVAQELRFYRERNVPVPHLHPHERHRKRLRFINPRKLWDRECAKCQKPISTSYAPERREIVYCERCYLETVY